MRATWPRPALPPSPRTDRFGAILNLRISVPKKAVLIARGKDEGNLPGDEQVRDGVGKHPAKIDVHNRAVDVRPDSIFWIALSTVGTGPSTIEPASCRASAKPVAMRCSSSTTRMFRAPAPAGQPANSWRPAPHRCVEMRLNWRRRHASGSLSWRQCAAGLRNRLRHLTDIGQPRVVLSWSCLNRKSTLCCSAIGTWPIAGRVAGHKDFGSASATRGANSKGGQIRLGATR
jgi:hypothetical protein